MYYYHVNYIILDNRTVIKNESVGVSLHTFANIDDFKKTIVAMKNVGSATENIVIKSYNYRDI